MSQINEYSDSSSDVEFWVEIRWVCVPRKQSRVGAYELVCKSQHSHVIGRLWVVDYALSVVSALGVFLWVLQ
jgi:hypothetical protein